MILAQSTGVGLDTFTGFGTSLLQWLITTMTTIRH